MLFLNVACVVNCNYLMVRPGVIVVSWGSALGNPFQSGLRIWGQGQSKSNLRAFQMPPNSWVSLLALPANWLDWKAIAC